MTTQIQTPRGMVVMGKRGNAQLVWNTKFVQKWTEKYSRAQKFVDNAVLYHSEPYVPMKTGMLRKSGILGTKIGSGLVSWIAPYAKHQYYKGRQPGESSAGPLAGRLWFERMKATWKDSIVKGAKKFMGDS